MLKRYWQPITLYALSLLLLLTTTLASSQLVGSDIHVEYYYAKQAMDGWDSSLPHANNAALSITVLAPFLARLLPIDIIWVFKVVFPAMFAFLPVLLYRLFRHIVDDKRAFLAALFFVVVPSFTLELTGVARQQIGELLMALGLLTLVQKWSWRIRLPIVTILGVLVTFSHYSLGILFLAFPLTTLVYLGLQRKGRLLMALSASQVVVVGVSLLFFSSVASGWVMTHIGNVVAATPVGQTAVEEWREDDSAPSTVLVTPPSQQSDMFRTATGLDFMEVDGWGKAFRVVQILTQVAVLVGCVVLLRRKLGIYKPLLAASLFMLLLAVAYRPIGELLNLSRYYHIALMTMAPAFVVGIEKMTGRWQWLAPAIIPVYFLFTSGLVFYAVGYDNIETATVPYSIALENRRLDAGAYLTDNDDAVAQWAFEQGITPVYADIHGVLVLQHHYTMWDALPLPLEEDSESMGSYVLLREWNIKKGTLTYWNGPGLRRQEPNWVNGRIVHMQGSALLVKVK